MKYSIFSVNTSHELTPVYETLSGKRAVMCFSDEQDAIRLAKATSKAWKAPMYILKTIDYKDDKTDNKPIRS